MTAAILTVSELNRHVRAYLEHEMGQVCVSGEISNLSKPSSGHFYFTLKDESAQVRCVYFRNRHTRAMSLGLQNGQHVVARGQLSLYEARGDYQLIVDELSDAGQGDLYRQFELLKKKLAALGLFDAARKKTLPYIPECIGVITSASGAALQDILTTLARRFPLSPVRIYPSDVQGKQAVPQLIKALNDANFEKHCDVLILARGGGSIEDLWAFNDEALISAMVNSTIPIVTGIGHETDFTLADFVADVRAATPTAAAETVVPDRIDLTIRLQAIQALMRASITRYIRHKKLLLAHEVQKITSPGRLIASHWQALDYLDRRTQHAIRQLLANKQHRLNINKMRLNAQNPIDSIKKARVQLQFLNQNLLQKMDIKVTQCRQQLRTQMVTLHAVSPLATLDRGYAIATLDGIVLVDSQQVPEGAHIDVRLAKGSLKCLVKSLTS